MYYVREHKQIHVIVNYIRIYSSTGQPTFILLLFPCSRIQTLKLRHRLVSNNVNHVTSVGSSYLVDNINGWNVSLTQQIK